MGRKRLERNKIITILCNFFQTFEEEGTLTHFYQASVTLVPKQDKDITGKKWRPVFLKNIVAEYFNKL